MGASFKVSEVSRFQGFETIARVGGLRIYITVHA
jgi:hypothetical protein